MTGKPSLRRRVHYYLAALIALFASAAGAAPAEVTVFAAASLTNALSEIGDDFAKDAGVRPRLSFASSAVLARQIEAGAPADVFVSADAQWMDYLAGRALIDVATRRDLLRNRLVLIAPADAAVRLRLVPHAPLAAALGGGRLATGDPDSVPVGLYAKAALAQLGLWDSIADRVLRTENVRAALAIVARGEAPLGIVYATDAKIEPKVRIVDTFPEDSHPPILYPVALTRGASPQARRFLDYLTRPQARAVFEKYGFTPLL